jgi:hypothetical protein
MQLLISMVTHDLTKRETRGLAIANTIGRRNNQDVTIKRYNKLTYKVKSQSSSDTWYTVIKSYSDGWTCDCPDYSFRHTECKHIHAVKFSKLLRKQIYQDTFPTQTALVLSDITKTAVIYRDIYAKTVALDLLSIHLLNTRKLLIK